MKNYLSFVVVTSILLSISACGGGSGEASADVVVGPEPDASNMTLPVFSKPFTGDFVNTNPFDHYFPSYPAVDDNRDFIDYRGIDVNLGWDGHNGHDWSMPTGTELLAVADGRVEFVGTEACNWANANGDNLLLRIRHDVGDGLIFDTIYVHVSEFRVAVGDTVKRGDVIALSGNTGCSTGPHLHFMVRRVTQTNNGLSTLIDPFGWQGEEQDRWEYHVDGAQSLWLWRRGEAPRPHGYIPPVN